jgi:hypothetical protein
MTVPGHQGLIGDACAMSAYHVNSGHIAASRRMSKGAKTGSQSHGYFHRGKAKCCRWAQARRGNQYVVTPVPDHTVAYAMDK